MKQKKHAIVYAARDQTGYAVARCRCGYQSNTWTPFKYVARKDILLHIKREKKNDA